jgi:hypothetical protein
MNRRVFLNTILSAIFSKDRWKKWFPPKKIIPKWDPIAITLIRKEFPNLIAQQICGVQPICGTTSSYLIHQNFLKEKEECNNFSLNSRYETN